MPRQATHQTKPDKEKAPKRQATAAGEKDAAVNRAASHNYFLLEKFEAGIALTGTEVKSVRAGRANLKDSYGIVKNNELWLLNAHISPYEHGNIFNHEALANAETTGPQGRDQETDWENPAKGTDADSATAVFQKRPRKSGIGAG